MELCVLVPDYLRHIELERNLSPSTVIQYRRDLTKWLEYLTSAGVPLTSDAVTVEVMRTWLRWRASQDVSPVTVNRELAAIRSCWNFACRFHQVTSNPAASVPSPKTPERLPELVSRSDVQKLLEACDQNYYGSYRPRDKAIIALLATLGLRRQELINLRIQDCDLPARTLAVRSGKGRKDRMLPLTDELVNLLSDWLAVRPKVASDHLFVGRGSGQLRPSSLQRMLARLSEMAGLEKRPHLHSFRHYAATSMVQAEGGGLEKARRLLGHRGYDTLRVYTHLQVDDLRSAVSSGRLLAKTGEVSARMAWTGQLDPATELAERALREQVQRLPGDWQRSEQTVRMLAAEWTRQSVPEHDVALLREEVERIVWHRETISRLDFDTHLIVAAFGGSVYRQMHQVAGTRLTVSEIRVLGEDLLRGFTPILGSAPSRTGDYPVEPVWESENRNESPVVEVLLDILDVVEHLRLHEGRTPGERMVAEAVVGLVSWSYGFPPVFAPAAERPLWRLLVERTRGGDSLPIMGYCIAKMRSGVRLVVESALPA